MLRKWNRFLAIILAFALVTTTFNSDIACAHVLAEEDVVDEPSGDNEEQSEDGDDEEYSEEDEASFEEEQGDYQEEGQEEIPEEADNNVDVDGDENIDEPATENDESIAEEHAQNVENAGEVVAEEDIQPSEDEVKEVTPDNSTEGSDVAAEEATNGGEVVDDPAKAGPEDEDDSADSATNSSTEESAEAASTASTEEEADAASSASIQEEEENIITIKYRASDNGSVSNEEEEIDLNDDDIVIEGSTAIPDDGYVFLEWKDEDGEVVSEDATFVPSDLEADVTFTAYFKEKEIEMPAQSFSGSAGSVTVHIDAPEGAFPEDTKMHVTEVTDEAILNAVKEAADSSVDNENQKAIAVDISFTYKDEEIEPKAPITVKMYSSIIDEEKDTQVVHVDDEGNTEVVGDADISGTSAEFTSDEFSVYAIVITDPETLVTARRTYLFYDINDDGVYVAYEFYNEAGETVNNQIIKSGDKLDNVNTPYHPGKEFLGWFLFDGENYGEQVILGEVKEFEITEDETVELYAKYNNHFIVTYLDENGASEGTAVVTTVDGSYTINMPYEPKTQDSAFLGWNPTEDSSENIVVVEPVDAVAPYPNGTKIRISADVVFRVYSPEGHWLIFDENAKGASYTPSVFVKNGDNTVEPTKVPTRKGYTFDGWYTGKPASYGEDPAGTKFVFGSPIDVKTTLYAKWKSAEKAPYTVIIWKKDLNNNYEYSESIDVAEGTVGQVVSNIELHTEDCYITINGENYGGPENPKEPGDWDPKYIGFKPVDYDRDVVIKPEGNSVVNVYFDRIEYEFKFYLGRGSGGRYTVYRTGDKSSVYNNVRISTSDCSGAATDGNGIYISISAKYGQDISGMWPEYSVFTGVESAVGHPLVSWILMDNAMARLSSANDGSTTVKGKITIMDEQILGDWKHPDANYVDARYMDNPYQYTYYIFVEEVAGETGIAYVEGDPSYPGYILKERVPSRANSDFNKQKAPAYEGFTAEMVSATQFRYEREYDYSGTLERGISFFYTRNKRSIIYMDGSYVDGNGVKVAGIEAGTKIHEEENIPYGSALAAYDKGGSKYYDPSKDDSFHGYDGFVFAGWYKNKECTETYSFPEKMGNDNIVVYAKWVQEQFRVFLHPNGRGKAGYGIGGQSTSFRVDYNARIDATSPVSSDYDFVGWYKDEGCTEAFNIEAFTLNDTTVTTPYDQTEPTERNEYGEPTSDENKDKSSGRTWITKKLDLYAKWRSKLAGANGIGIEYDVNGNFSEVFDTTEYADNSFAVAKDCPESLAPTSQAGKKMRFDHWVVQKYVDTEYVDTQVTVKEGSAFTVLKDNAKQEKIGTDDAGFPKYKYTVRLKAVFVEKKNDDVLLTKIVYNGNGGTTSLTTDASQNLVVSEGGAVATYSKLQINAALDITAQGFTRENYEFLGWANEDPNAETPDFKIGDKVGVNELDPNTNTLYAVWKVAPVAVTVTITGNNSTDGYDGNAHTTTGYEVEISDSRYTENDFSFSGEASAERTDVGTTEMGLAISQFKNENSAFNVTFVIAKDGYQKIEPANITVNIKGNTDTKAYNGSEQEVTGYEVEIPEGALFTKDEIVFSGEAKAAGTTVNTYPMGLKEDQFSEENANYNVTFSVADGWLKITKKAITVTITGNNHSDPYNGQEYTVTGYTADTAEDGFDVDTDITFTGTASATQKDAGTKYMGLDVSQFASSNDNYAVTFTVVDGYQKVTPITDKVTVTITGNKDSKDYNGQEQEVKGYKFESDNSLFTEDYVTFEGTARAAGTNVDIYLMGLAKEQFSNNSANFTNVTFEVTDGQLDITPIDVTVTIVGNNNKVTYDGQEHEVNGYKVTYYSTDLYTREDFNFDESEGMAVVKRKDEGTSYMGLKPERFINNNGNFKTVTFNVTDGYITIVPIGEVVVTITGNKGTFDYDGVEHSVDGYTAKFSDPLYTEDDFTFSGSATVTRLEAGTDNMGLSVDDFTNNSTNFKKVTFEVTDGSITINPISVTVNITGNNDTVKYIGKNQFVEGFEAISESELYNVEMINYKGQAKAERTEVGTTNMNLDSTLFENTDNNFKNVNFVIVDDGFITVEPLPVKITVTGNTKEETYDGKEKVVTGYIPTADNELYQISKVDMTGKAEARGTIPGTYNMNLTAEQFTNTDENFLAEFEVVDGYLIIKDRGEGEKFQVTVITDDVQRPYTGQTYSGFDYHAEGGRKVNALTAQINRVIEFISGILSPMSVGAEEGISSDKDITIDGVSYKVTGLKVDTAERNAGKYPLTISGVMKVFDKDGNDVTEQFDAPIKKEGTLTITPMPITVTSGSASKSYDGTALTSSEITTDRAWGEGDAVGYNITGKQIEVGESDNTFDIIGAGTTDLDNNYVVTKVYGKLTVSDAQVVPPAPAPTPTPTPAPAPNPTPTPATGGDDTPATIDDTPTPAAPAPVVAPTPAPIIAGTPDPAVLGAQRAANGAAVLGARRARTEDSTNDVTRLFAIIIAAAVALTLISRKKKEQE